MTTTGETNPCQPSMVNFFIFDTSRVVAEDEEYKNIVYFYPQETSLDIQMKQVGRAAAILKFSQTFGPSDGCRSLHTKKTRQYFHEPEPSFVMVMTVRVPDNTPGDSALPATDVHDKVFQTLLVHSYKMFRLFMGTMRPPEAVSCDEDADYEQLQIRTSYFFSKHLQFMPMEDADLADAFLGIQFLPLDKLSFLKVRSLVHNVEQIFPCVQSTTILYQDQIVWTGLCQEDVQLVYNYLTTGLFPACMELNPEQRFLTGRADLRDDTSEGRLPRVFLNHQNPVPDECHLVVYRTSGATICLFIPASFDLHREFFITLDAALGPRMSSLATDVSEQTLLRKNPPSTNLNNESIRFLYFNSWNMAFKSTLHQNSHGLRRVLQCHPSSNLEVIKTCADLSEDFSSWNEGEIIVKTKSDSWVVGKLSNERELYVIVTRKNAELIDICDEVRRIKNVIFKDILLLE